MRILVVSQYFWPENFKINDFVLGMKEMGHSVTVFTGKPNYPSGKYFKGYNFFNRRKENFKEIKVIRSPLITRGNGSGFRLTLNYFSFALFSSISAIFRIREKFDLIFVYEPSPITVGIPAIILKRKLGIPIFFWVQDLWPESLEAAGNIRNKRILNLVNKLVIIIYRYSDRIFISSRSFEGSLMKKNVVSSKIVYYPNWAEDIYLSGSINTSKYSGIMPDGFKIMFAGNIGNSQDFEAIVMAANLLKSNKKLHWVIIGDGRKKEWLQSEVEKHNLSTNFHILGSFPREEMADLFYHCDTMLVTLKDSEIFRLTVPAKIQSYLAFGKPVLAMMNGEGAEIIEKANAGLTCEAGNYRKLAANIEHLWSMEKDNLIKMGDNGRQYYFNNFSRLTLFKKFEDVYINFQEDELSKKL